VIEPELIKTVIKTIAMLFIVLGDLVLVLYLILHKTGCGFFIFKAKGI